MAQKKKANEKGGQKHELSCIPPAHPFDVILARPTDKSVTVSVVAYKEMEGFIAYGKEKGTFDRKTETRTLMPQEPVEFVLKDLDPGTQYQYRLHTREAKAETFTADADAAFHTQRRPGDSFCFTVQSDSHLDQQTRAPIYERTLANALAAKPDFHIDIGDTFMTDKYERYQDALPQYMAQRYYFGQLGRSCPLFLVLGNHDGERLDRYAADADNMPTWSNRLRRKLFPNPFPDGFYSGNNEEKKGIGPLEDYYAWEWGDALFVALDPFWYTPRVRRGSPEGNWARTLGKEQYDWLAKTLAGSKAKYKFVFIHHLVGGLDDSARGGSEAAVLYEWGGKGKDGAVEFKAKRPGWEMPIHDLMRKYKVSIVFHGHDHFFAKQELDEIVYLMVPQPGHAGYERVRNAEEYGYIRGDFLPPSGHIRVTVSPAAAKVEYVRTYLPRDETNGQLNGKTGYAFTIRR